jgi:hypothetical protein
MQVEMSDGNYYMLTAWKAYCLLASVGKVRLAAKRGRCFTVLHNLKCINIVSKLSTASTTIYEHLPLCLRPFGFSPNKLIPRTSSSKSIHILLTAKSTSIHTATKNARTLTESTPTASSAPQRRDVIVVIPQIAGQNIIHIVHLIDNVLRWICLEDGL